MIIYLYLLKRFLHGLFISLVVLISIEIFFSFTAELKYLDEGDYDLMSIVEYIILSIPRSIQIMFPYAVLIGTLLSLGSMASDMEFVAMQSAGMSVKKIIYIVLFQVFIISSLFYIITDFTVPRFSSIAEKERNLALKRQTIYQKNGIWFKNGNSFIKINEIYPDNSIRGITVYDYDNNELSFVRYIQSAKLEQERLSALLPGNRDLGSPLAASTPLGDTPSPAKVVNYPEHPSQAIEDIAVMVANAILNGAAYDPEDAGNVSGPAEITKTALDSIDEQLKKSTAIKEQEWIQMMKTTIEARIMSATSTMTESDRAQLLQQLFAANALPLSVLDSVAEDAGSSVMSNSAISATLDTSATSTASATPNTSAASSSVASRRSSTKKKSTSAKKKSKNRPSLSGDSSFLHDIIKDVSQHQSGDEETPRQRLQRKRCYFMEKLRKRQSAEGVDTMLKNFLKKREQGAEVLTHRSFDSLFKVANKRKEFLEYAATPISQDVLREADYKILRQWGKNPSHKAEAKKFGLTINGRSSKADLCKAKAIVYANKKFREEIVSILISAYEDPKNQIEVYEMLQLLVLLYPHENFETKTMEIFLTNVHAAELVRNLDKDKQNEFIACRDRAKVFEEVALATREQFVQANTKEEQQDIINKLETEYQAVQEFCKKKMRDHPPLNNAIKSLLLDLRQIFAVAKGDVEVTSSSASSASLPTSIKIDGRELPLNLSRKEFIGIMTGYYWSQDPRVQSKNDDSFSVDNPSFATWQDSTLVSPSSPAQGDDTSADEIWEECENKAINAYTQKYVKEQKSTGNQPRAEAAFVDM